MPQFAVFFRRRRRPDAGAASERLGAGSGVPEAAVTDTHPLLFHAAGSRRLGRRAAEMFAAAERQAAIIYVPAAVIWECGLLAWTGRVDLRRPLPQFFADLFSNPAYQAVDLTPEQIYQADAARPNRDPFDALICAAARHLELALVTRDGDIRQSGLVRVIW
jgi:PIN domain nuclease of toxin-antitoxin system